MLTLSSGTVHENGLHTCHGVSTKHQRWTDGSKSFEGLGTSQRSGQSCHQPPVTLLRQSRVAPSRGGRWRNSSSLVSAKVRSLEAALAALGSEEVGARAELEAALHRARKATKRSDAQFSLNPDTRTAEARLKVSKLERSLEALDGTSGVEVQAIKTALKKARAAAQDKPITDLIAECKGFTERSERRVQKLEAERLSESTVLEEGRARLARLEAQAAVSVPLPIPVQVPDMEAEVSRLREELAIARGEDQPPKKRLREDFAPSTVEEAASWMRCMHLEMEEAVSKGNEADVSRLAQVIAEGAAQSVSGTG